MTFVVTEHCRDCRYTDCVAVCPVDCFHADERMLYIDPARCIDCGACIPECPVEAIYEEGTLPRELEHWLAINAERAKLLPVLNVKVAPLGTADERASSLGYAPAQSSKRR
jgi:ferredoxin